MLDKTRATALTGGATLTVPFPTNQTSLSGPLQGLHAGAVTVTVYNQTTGSGFNPVGSISLTVNDTRCGACVTGITPNPADLAAAPGSFTLSGGGFADAGFGLPVGNFLGSGGVLVGEGGGPAGTGRGATHHGPFPADHYRLKEKRPGGRSGTVT